MSGAALRRIFDWLLFSALLLVVGTHYASSPFEMGISFLLGLVVLRMAFMLRQQNVTYMGVSVMLNQRLAKIESMLADAPRADEADIDDLARSTGLARQEMTALRIEAVTVTILGILFLALILAPLLLR